MKPTIIRNRQFFKAPNHMRSKQLGATLSKDLREKYGKRSARVVEGDTVRVMRGEFKGIDGKVTQVSTEKNGIAVEGIKREKLKGGNVDIYIHTSNVMITGLKLDDKWRQSRLEGQKAKVIAEKPKEVSKQEVPKSQEASMEEAPKPKEIPKQEVPKSKKAQKEKQNAKAKDKPKEKSAKSPAKRTKQTKTANQAKKETE